MTEEKIKSPKHNCTTPAFIALIKEIKPDVVITNDIIDKIDKILDKFEENVTQYTW